MSTKSRLKRIAQHLNISERQFELSIGVSNGYINNAPKTLSNKIAEQIIDKYSTINKIWLLTGEGEMLKSDISYSVNQNETGVPYYDVDFIGGFDLVENDQTINPTYHVNFPLYDKADCWINITGHSMEPLINNGDIVAMRRIDDWQTYILYGEVYAIVTDEYRTVKRVRRSNKGDNFIRLIPVNADYDEQDIPTSVVRQVYQILGCAKRIF